MFWEYVKKQISPRPNDPQFNLQLGMCTTLAMLIGYSIHDQ